MFRSSCAMKFDMTVSTFPAPEIAASTSPKFSPAESVLLLSASVAMIGMVVTGSKFSPPKNLENRSVSSIMIDAVIESWAPAR